MIKLITVFYYLVFLNRDLDVGIAIVEVKKDSLNGIFQSALVMSSMHSFEKGTVNSDVKVIAYNKASMMYCAIIVDISATIHVKIFLTELK